MEEEAYLTGNMMFATGKTLAKENEHLTYHLLLEKIKMSDQLNRLVAEKVIAQLNEQGVEIDEEFS